MANNYRPSWKAEVGINYVPAYQVSGRPYASGTIDSTANTTEGVKIEFPTVTRWVAVINNDVTNSVRVAFSQNGLKGGNHFTIGPKRDGSTARSSAEGPLEFKVSEIWISGSTDVDIVAGLTSIETAKCSGSSGTSWSGSIGVG
jgi:hypothetical protein